MPQDGKFEFRSPSNTVLSTMNPSHTARRSVIAPDSSKDKMRTAGFVEDKELDNPCYRVGKRDDAASGEDVEVRVWGGGCQYSLSGARS